MTVPTEAPDTVSRHAFDALATRLAQDEIDGAAREKARDWYTQEEASDMLIAAGFDAERVASALTPPVPYGKKPLPSLDELCENCTFLREVVDGKTTYRKLARALRPVFEPNHRERLRAIFGGKTFDKELYTSLRDDFTVIGHAVFLQDYYPLVQWPLPDQAQAWCVDRRGRDRLATSFVVGPPLAFACAAIAGSAAYEVLSLMLGPSAMGVGGFILGHRIAEISREPYWVTPERFDMIARTLARTDESRRVAEGKMYVA